MKCLIVLSLVAFACAGPLESGVWPNIWLHKQLAGQWGPVQQQWPYGYHQGIYGQQYEHPLIHQYGQESVHPLFHQYGQQYVHPLYQHLWGPTKAHEQVIEEHPVGQIGKQPVVEQIVAQDQQAAMHSVLGHEYGIEHPYGGQEFYSPYLHKELPYGYYKTEGHMTGYPHYPLNIWAQQGQGIGGHYYPWGLHHSNY